MSLNPNTYLNPSLYGEYRTNSFVDIYPNAEAFAADYADGIGMAFQINWEKRLDIQDKLRAIPELDLLSASKIIYNHAYNPGTEPTTATLEELEAINEQNTTNYKRSKLDAYGTLIDLLETDVTSSFLDKFKRLFIVVVEPQKSLYYENDPENIEIYL